jgi:hypothetical protein
MPARVTRITNLVVATLYLPVTIYNAAGESWNYAYCYGLSIGLEVLLLAFILRTAWTWPRLCPKPDSGGYRDGPVCGPDRRDRRRIPAPVRAASLGRV